MARKEKTQTKRPVETYEHRDKERLNNPPVGLVTPDTDPDTGQKAKNYAYDPPLVDRKKTRVSGPFTVEAVPAPAVKSIDDTLTPNLSQRERWLAADTSIARSGETLRQGEWRDELLRTGIRAKAGQYIRFVHLEPLPGCRFLHAEGEIRPSDEGAEGVLEVE